MDDVFGDDGDGLAAIYLDNLSGRETDTRGASTFREDRGA